MIRLTNQENRLDQIGERMTVVISFHTILCYRVAGTATSHIYAHYQFSEDMGSLW